MTVQFTEDLIVILRHTPPISLTAKLSEAGWTGITYTMKLDRPWLVMRACDRGMSCRDLGSAELGSNAGRRDA